MEKSLKSWWWIDATQENGDKKLASVVGFKKAANFLASDKDKLPPSDIKSTLTHCENNAWGLAWASSRSYEK